MSNKVVFLDYDGVVNTVCFNEEEHRFRFGYPDDNKVNNKQAVHWLSDCCKRYGYNIVVTSTWRMRDNYKECLINGGLWDGIEILGKTDVLRHACRGDEVLKYLREHPEIEDYIIIDDESDFLPEQSSRLILVDSDYGFGCRNAQEFKRIAEGDLDA